MELGDYLITVNVCDTSNHANSWYTEYYLSENIIDKALSIIDENKILILTIKNIAVQLYDFEPYDYSFVLNESSACAGNIMESDPIEFSNQKDILIYIKEHIKYNYGY